MTPSQARAPDQISRNSRIIAALVAGPVVLIVVVILAQDLFGSSVSQDRAWIHGDNAIERGSEEPAVERGRLLLDEDVVGPSGKKGG